MKNSKKIILEIIEQLGSVKYEGDLSDIGNEIGIVLGKYISEELGSELESFYAGIEHGISLTKGTH